MHQSSTQASTVRLAQGSQRHADKTQSYVIPIRLSVHSQQSY